MRHCCPVCGRTWPFDGSWQKDDRCFGCGYIPGQSSNSHSGNETVGTEKSDDSWFAFVLCPLIGFFSFGPIGLVAGIFLAVVILSIGKS